MYLTSVTADNAPVWAVLNCKKRLQSHYLRKIEFLISFSQAIPGVSAPYSAFGFQIKFMDTCAIFCDYSY